MRLEVFMLTQHNRRKILAGVIFIGLAILFALETSRAQTTAKRRPNILFLFSDDQRADTIRALGNAHITTPNLDRLVNEGMTFNRAYCMGAQQGAVCVPSSSHNIAPKYLHDWQHTNHPAIVHSPGARST